MNIAELDTDHFAPAQCCFKDRIKSGPWSPSIPLFCSQIAGQSQDSIRVGWECKGRSRLHRQCLKASFMALCSLSRSSPAPAIVSQGDIAKRFFGCCQQFGAKIQQAKSKAWNKFLNFRLSSTYFHVLHCGCIFTEPPPGRICGRNWSPPDRGS